MRFRRAVAALLAGAGVLGTLATCAGPAAPPVVSPGARPGGPVQAPAAGVLVGAWVRPRHLTEDERFTAVRGFERALGRPLAIVNTYRRLDEDFATPSDRRFALAGATLMISWAVGDTRSIALGRHDDVLRTRARTLRELGTPVLLRFRWEMDRPNLAPYVHSPRDYIEAWRHTRRIFEAERVRNVAWVWCPTAEGFADGHAPAYFPGDDTVDWTCVDAYTGTDLASLRDLIRPFLAWAARHPQPVVIGEFGVGRSWGPQARASWLREAFDHVRTVPQIKAVVYFESDPDGRDAAHSFSLSDDPLPLAAFTSATHHPHYTP